MRSRGRARGSCSATPTTCASGRPACSPASRTAASATSRSTTRSPSAPPPRSRTGYAAARSQPPDSLLLVVDRDQRRGALGPGLLDDVDLEADVLAQVLATAGERVARLAAAEA